MTGDYTRWYRTGSVTVTKNSVTVTGKDTEWNTAGLKPGDIFGITENAQFEIDQIVNNTSLKLKTAYTGNTASNQAYYIIRQFNATFGAQAAAQATSLFADVKKFIDGKQEAIHGKSAYDIAVDNGYVGTQKQWLDSLGNGDRVTALEGRATTLENKSGSLETRTGNLETRTNNQDVTLGRLDKRTNIFGYTENGDVNNPSNIANIKNLIIQHKYIGDHITDEQYAAIANGTFEGLNLGNRWHIPVDLTEATQQKLIETGLMNDNNDETAGSLIVIIIDFNYYTSMQNTGQFYLGPNHLLCMLMSEFANGHNIKPFLYLGDDLNTTPYYDCTLRTELIQGIIVPQLQNLFGEHLMPMPVRLVNGYSENYAPTSILTTQSYCELPSDFMMIGGYYGVNNEDDGFDMHQASYFKARGRIHRPRLLSRNARKGRHIVVDWWDNNFYWQNPSNIGARKGFVFCLQ